MYRMVLACLILNGCASAPKTYVVADDDILVKEFFSLHSPVTLTKSELQEDIAVLTYAFQNGYGGRKYISQNKYQTAIA